MRNVICLMILGLGSMSIFSQVNPATTKTDSFCRIDSLVFATGIVSRDPVGVSNQFEASVGKVCCWTRVSTQKTPVTIKHVWYKEGRKVLEIPLTLEYFSGRLWSNKNITAGEWKVEVLDGAGEIIGSGKFTVK